MPKEFVGNVETPMDIRFGENAPVDTGEGYKAALKNMDGIVENAHVATMGLLENQFQAVQDREEDFYGKARNLKRGIYDAAQANDQEAVTKYSQQLEQLKIAERQGAISGQNSQIRQETLLKTMVNRFPHLEEKIRQTYSATRARAQAEREQFKDPIEEGIDNAIREAAATGMPLNQYLDYTKSMKQFALSTEVMAESVRIGKNIQGDFAKAIDESFMALNYANLQNRMTYAVNQANTPGSTFNAEQYKLVIDTMKRDAILGFDTYVNQLLRQSPNSDAVLDPTFLAAKKKELVDMYDDAKGNLSNFDALVGMKRYQEIAKFQSWEDMRSIHPIVKMMVDLDPKNGADWLASGFVKSEQIYTSSRGRLVSLINSAATGAESVRLRTHLNMLDSMQKDGQFYRDAANLAQGNPMETFGDTELDAVRYQSAVDSTIGADSLSPELKSQAGIALVDSEQHLSGPTEYLAPGPQLYRNPTSARFYRQDAPAKAHLTQTIESATAALIQKFDPKVSSSLTFSTDLEGELRQKGGEVWKAYGDNGGPFKSMEADQRDQRARGAEQDGLDSLASTYREQGAWVSALNNSYWNMRNMHGPAKAEAWAMDVLTMLKQGEQDAEGDGEVAQVDDDGLPVFNADLTD